MSKAMAIKQAYQPNKRAIGELLALTNPSIIVPDWQRNYSWQPTHVDTFWNDILLFSQRSGAVVSGEYFLGSVVLVNGEDGRLLLLDGQQRLATSTILLSVIRDRIFPFNNQASMQVQQNYLSGFDFAKNLRINKLRLNVYDRDYFRRLILDERTGEYSEPEPERASHRLIKLAREYFEKRFEEASRGVSPDQAFEWALRVQNILTNHMTVIAVTSDNEDSAAEVFETLNDRGISLSTPDLLRNLVIRRAKEGEEEQLVERWRNVISFQSDNEIKMFLRHYWISKYGDVKTQSLYREMKQAILDRKLDSLELSTQLSDGALLYQSLQRAEHDDEDISKLLEDVQNFGSGGNILFPSMISIFQELKDPDTERALKALVHVYVRDGLIGQIENSVLENRFYRAARNLRDHRSADNFCSEVNAEALTDDDVKLRFQTLSMSHNDSRRYILYKIELSKRATEELDINPPSKVHVEHIYPQTPIDAHRLPNHTRWVNRLGNLSLLSKRINTSIKNGSFEAKKVHYANSEIVITKDLIALDVWDETSIADRQNKFAESVADLWPLIT